jgi:mono/diheme cytochrome c family protein
MLISRDDALAVAADADRDRVWIVDLARGELRHTVLLDQADEPGRVVEDGAGGFHVVLRGGGAIASIDRKTFQHVRRPVCPAPRGIGYEAGRDLLHVACLGGELVSLPAAAGAPIRLVRPDSDLRDVVLLGGRLFVSRFRSAEVLEIDQDGAVISRRQVGGPGDSVAWRMIAGPGGDLIVLHQRAAQRVVSIKPRGYQISPERCRGLSLVEARMTRLPPSGPPLSSAPLSGVAPMDVAISADERDIQVINAGQMSGCTNVPTGYSIAFTRGGLQVWQTREPSLIFGERRIPLPGESKMDRGRDLFYTAPNDNPIACVSCHPEGGDDGQVWKFETLGPRRTQHPRGALLGSEPFHWSGDMADFAALVKDVFVSRMGMAPPSAQDVQQLARWLDSQPPWPVSLPADVSAVERGRQLFWDPQVGCGACHTGPRLSNNQTVDVGTGGAIQVPSLVGVALRAPYLHDGSAATLADRFKDRSDRHGRTSHLRPEQIQDLVSYLESL